MFLSTDPDAEGLAHLPFFDPITEDEQHFLVSCPKFHQIRLALEENVKSALLSWEKHRLEELFHSPHVVSLAKYVHKLMQMRFPDVDNLKKKPPTKKRTATKKNT